VACSEEAGYPGAVGAGLARFNVGAALRAFRAWRMGSPMAIAACFQVYFRQACVAAI